MNIYQGLETLGVKREQIVADYNNAFYADSLYTLEFRFCGDLIPFLIINLRDHFVKQFKLDYIKPFRFVAFNRKNMSRRIGNFNELMDLLCKKFLNIKWEEAKVSETLTEQAKYFNEVKFIFSIHDSIFANTIFVQPGATVVNMQIEQWLSSFLYLARYTDKIMVTGRDPKISWRGLKPNILNLEYVETFVERALKKLELI